MGIPTAVAPTTKHINPKTATHVEYKGFTSLAAILPPNYHHSPQNLHPTLQQTLMHNTRFFSFAMFILQSTSTVENSLFRSSAFVRATIFLDQYFAVYILVLENLDMARYAKGVSICGLFAVNLGVGHNA